MAEVLSSLRHLVLVFVMGVSATAGAQQFSSLIRDIQQGSAGSSPTGVVSLGDVVIFAANDGQSGLEPWRSDGTAAGTYRLQDIRPGALSGLTSPVSFLAAGSQVFFVADAGGTGFELWKTDGTEGGTTLVRDIRPGTIGATPLLGVAIGDTVYFYASDGTTGIELWKSDGTLDGTVLIKDIRAGPNSGPQGPLTLVGSTLFFSAYAEAATGVELWKSDGTSAGTVMVKDIAPGPGLSEPQSIVAVGNTAYFIANDGSTGEELWKSDGTPDGTLRVADLVPGAEPGLAGVTLTAGANAVFFSARLGTQGEELWRSDGTAAGTLLLKDIQPGPDSSLPRLLTAAGGTLFFFADTPGLGVELWKSDGTPAGTALVQDIRSGRLGSISPLTSFMTAFGGKVVFAADNGVTGVELWKSDGTERGTLAVEDRRAGQGGAIPQWAVALGDGIAVAQDDGSTGTELWRLPSWALDTTPPEVTPSAVGTLGANGFYTSHVSVTWTAADPDSPLLDTANCGTSTVTSDTAGATVTCAATSGGGTARVSVVIKRDTTPPSITCPVAPTAGGRSGSDTPVSYAPATAQDAIDPAPALSYSRPSGSSFPLGTTPVTVTATDAAGLSASCTFNVMVVADSQAPAVTCPADLTTPATGEEGASVSYPAASASDDLDAQPTLTYSQASGATFPVGDTSVTVTARDAAGNTSTCTFKVTVTRPPGVPPPEESGCSCAASSSPGGALWLLLSLAALAAARRPRGSRIG